MKVFMSPSALLYAQQLSCGHSRTSVQKRTNIFPHDSKHAVVPPSLFPFGEMSVVWKSYTLAEPILHSIRAMIIPSLGLFLVLSIHYIPHQHNQRLFMKQCCSLIMCHLWCNTFTAFQNFSRSLQALRFPRPKISHMPYNIYHPSSAPYAVLLDASFGLFCGTWTQHRRDQHIDSILAGSMFRLDHCYTVHLRSSDAVLL